ncbi:recombinase family protein, partial [Frankia sp. Cr1]|uniref:recombinase family protein n=1 Tax=Frankia sp. Cr1 TaxID=3073931 RepID=UPI002AD35DA0
ADGRKAFRDAMTAAAAESDKISERSKRGRRRKARRGLSPFGTPGFGMARWQPKPDGWESGDPRQRIAPEVVDRERAAIRDCYRRLLAGTVTVSTLAAELNAQGLHTIGGKPWTRGMLASMLQRPSLAGLIEINGEIIGTMRNAEPVVSREEWERLCALLAARRPGRPPGRVHVLSGLLTCDGCGRRMYGLHRSQEPPYPDGGVKSEYRCRREPGRPGCGRNFIDGQAAQAAVAIAVQSRLSDPRRAATVVARIAATVDERAALDAEIAHLNAEADALAEKTARWGVQRVHTSMEPLLRRIDVLTSRLAALEVPADPAAVAADVAAEWDRAEAAGEIDTMRAMIRAAFPNLTVRRSRRRLTARGADVSARFDWDGTGVGLPPLPPSTEEQIRAALAAAGGASVREVAAAVGMHASHVYRRLEGMHTAGEVLKSSRPMAAETRRTESVYRLPTPDQTAS